MLLVVAESSGSSPGRAGYKMAVGSDGELCGSIGGGVMEVSLVEQAKVKSKKAKEKCEVKEQVHRKNVPDSSGMICSGKQTVIFKELSPKELVAVEAALNALETGRRESLVITASEFTVQPSEGRVQNAFERHGEKDFKYTAVLGENRRLYIIGGGHCAFALSELMSKLEFHIAIFDDRPSLNTLEKNKFADEITIIDGYEGVAEHIPNGDDVYVVVMTLGYASDAVVIRRLVDRDVKYIGVLGSKAKMASLLKELKNENFPTEKLARIHTPIGLPINSRTPEEIAVSIAAEIISIKNA
jgi:xanthine dehydrogenase accessory factor